ncbi:hypothetical protein [Azospirillum argentinense]
MHDTVDLVWWISAVELPVMGGLFWLITRLRNDSEAAQAKVRESLAAYKLEVAKTYVSFAMLRDVEQRLADHLLRIEAKLESGCFSDGRQR